jgi:small subunit ribosomal protein S2
MLEAGVHFGHQTRFWNPKMAPYIFGHRSKIHIVNLEATVPLLDEAMNYLSKLAAQGAQILFVGTKRAAHDAIANEAARCGMPYVNQRWLGGTLTNFATVRRSVKRMLELEAMSEDGTMDRLIKKEAVRMRREQAKLEASLGGIRNLEAPPDALFVVDVGYEKIAVAEARKLGIPVVAILDTNNDPDTVDYVIPGNDDAMSAIELFAHAAAEAILSGRESLPVIEGDAEDFVEEEKLEKLTRRRAPHGKKPATTAVVSAPGRRGPPAAQTGGKPQAPPRPATTPQVNAEKTVEAQPSTEPSESDEKAKTAESKPAPVSKKAPAPKKATTKKKAIAKKTTTRTKSATSKKAASAKAAPAKKAAAKSQSESATGESSAKRDAATEAKADEGTEKGAK